MSSEAISFVHRRLLPQSRCPVLLGDNMGQKVFVRFSLGEAASHGSLIEAKKRRCLALLHTSRMGGNLIKADEKTEISTFLGAV